MVPFWDLSGHINDLTSKKIPLMAPQNLIAKLFGQQPVESEGISIIKQRTRLKAEYIKPRSDLMACESLGRRIVEE
jgi:hypothetical protein